MSEEGRGRRAYVDQGMRVSQRARISTSHQKRGLFWDQAHVPGHPIESICPDADNITLQLCD
jgi:hypothetical protein